MNHVIVRFRNGDSSWSEFECGGCSVDVDMFDFDQINVLEAAEDDAEFPCPSCGVKMKVDDLTVDDK